MKKLAIILAVLAFSANAFAAQKSLQPGSVYSIGSINPVAFKTSPKVNIGMYLDVGAGISNNNTDWAATSYHLSAIGNAKGNGYWTSKSDPGMYYFSKTAGPAASDFSISASTTPSAAGWKMEGQ